MNPNRVIGKHQSVGSPEAAPSMKAEGSVGRQKHRTEAIRQGQGYAEAGRAGRHLKQVQTNV